MNMQTHQMEAEPIFDNPERRDIAITALVQQGFAAEVLPWIDEFEGTVLSPTTWVRVTCMRTGDDHQFFDEIKHLATPLGGFVVEAGYV